MSSSPDACPFFTGDDFPTELIQAIAATLRPNPRATDEPLLERENFVRMICGSLSLNLSEQSRALEAFPRLNPWQAQQLQEVFREERKKFVSLWHKHPIDVLQLSTYVLLMAFGQAAFRRTAYVDCDLEKRAISQMVEQKRRISPSLNRVLHQRPPESQSATIRAVFFPELQSSEMTHVSI